MSWNDYVTQLTSLDDSGTQPIGEVAIWGQNPPSEWISTAGLKSINVEEIKTVLGNRSNIFQNGLVIGGMKCVVLRDELDMEGVHMINLKTRPDSTGTFYLISIGKTHTAIIVVKGTENAIGGQVPAKLYKTIDHLRRANA